MGGMEEESKFYIFRPKGCTPDVLNDPNGSIVSGFHGDSLTLNIGRFESGGNWAGVKNGSDGWYVGDFNGDDKEDIMRYLSTLPGGDHRSVDRLVFRFSM